jgi:hypothetical protein
MMPTALMIAKRWALWGTGADHLAKWGGRQLVHLNRDGRLEVRRVLTPFGRKHHVVYVRALARRISPQRPIPVTEV